MTFNDQMIAKQIEWAREHIPVRRRGSHAHKLHKDDWEFNLWPGIRSNSANSLRAYMDANRVKPHSKENLKSSWILCANLYFPFRKCEESKQILADFMAQRVPEVQAIEEIELEFEPDEQAISQAALLGESGGRGHGQTSPDLGLILRAQDGERGIGLFESKYCESNFEPCTGYKPKKNTPVNPDKGRCERVETLLDDPHAQCHVASWGRRYWDHLAPVVNRQQIGTLDCCPAAKAGYQLFRQQAMAEGITQSELYDFAITGVAFDARNKTLRRCLRRTGIEDFTQGWEPLFDGRAKFITFTHQEWVEWVRRDAGYEWKDWIEYVSLRYGY
jgi:hypothetical protein